MYFGIDINVFLFVFMSRKADSEYTRFSLCKINMVRIECYKKLLINNNNIFLSLLSWWVCSCCWPKETSAVKIMSFMFDVI